MAPKTPLVAPGDATAASSGTDPEDTYGIDPAIYHRRWLILSVLCISLVTIVVAVSSLNVAIPTILREFHTTLPTLQWVVTGYSLTFAALLIIGVCLYVFVPVFMGTAESARRSVSTVGG